MLGRRGEGPSRIVKHKPVDATQWLLTGIFAVLLAIFGYVVKLTADVACCRTQVEALNSQMHDAAELVSKLVLKGNP